MTQRRIAIIRNAAPQDFGGGERFPVFLAEVLQKNNFEPVIISRSKKLLAFAKQRNQQTIRGWWWRKQQWSGLNNLLLPLYLLWQCALFLYYLQLFKKIKPSAVHIQSKDDFIAATHAAHALAIHTVWTDHADLKHIVVNTSSRLKNPIGKLILAAAKRADYITVVSKSEQTLISQHLAEGSPIMAKMQVVHNGVTDIATDYSSAKANTFTFLVASRLVTDKGINEVIAAFKRLHTENDNTELVLIGDGPEAAKMKQQALNTPSIIFKGHQSDPISFMARAHVFVHPTYHEGFSVALVEAGMMSLPIIATAVGGNVEIIESGKTGVLVPAKDTAALYDAMRQLLLNRGLCKELGENARNQYLANYQFDTIVTDSFIPLYGVSDEN